MKPFAPVLIILGLSLLSGCATSPPRQTDDVCQIFYEKDDWYDQARDAEQRWGSSIGTMMAMMHQESRFVAKAKPPRTYFLGVIPTGRKSDAYGYSQAKDSTWEAYQRSSGNWGANRSHFADAIDFIGWYNAESRKRSNIRPDDTYHLYLAYHEGHGGFNRRTFRNKDWLKQVAHKVSGRAQRYDRQLNRCRDDLEGPWWWPL